MLYGQENSRCYFQDRIGSHYQCLSFLPSTLNKMPCLGILSFDQVGMVPALVSCHCKMFLQGKVRCCAVAKRSFWANFGVCTSMVIREAIDRVKTRWDFDTSNRIVTVLSVGTCFTYIALHCILIPTRRAGSAFRHAQVWSMFSWQTGQAR